MDARQVHEFSLSHRQLSRLSIAVDVSEQNRADAERRILMEREAQARAEAENAVRSRDDVLAIVSHDLRNPLNIISMSIALLDAQVSEEARKEQLGIIRRAVTGMNRLINPGFAAAQQADSVHFLDSSLISAPPAHRTPHWPG